MNSILYPPIVDSYMPAFVPVSNEENDIRCKIYFSLSKFNSLDDFNIVMKDEKLVNRGSVQVSVLKQDTNMNVVNIKQSNCTTGIIIDLPIHQVTSKNNLYYVEIPQDDIENNWVKGWIYKVQLRLSRSSYFESDEKTNGMTIADWISQQSRDGNLSEWSTICIIKATGEIKYRIPIFNIDTTNEQQGTLGTGTLNSLELNVAGNFIRDEDYSELIYFYKFILYDENDNILENSNDIYANQYQDSDSFNYYFKYELENGKSYSLAFYFETINKYSGGFYKTDDIDKRYHFKCSYIAASDYPCVLLTTENDKEEIMKLLINSEEGIHIHKDSDIDFSPNPPLITEFDKEPDVKLPPISEEEDEGRVALKFYDETPNRKWTGNLCIRRTDSKSNFKIWEDIYIYVCNNEIINDIPIIYDYTIESGIWYKYGVQVINPNGDRGALWKDMVNPVLRNFNYSFLLGEDNQQLKLKFDNEMSSFKYQIYDSKTDTIGAKFPIITRNANIYYKTFPINGLISFNMDDNNLFTSRSKIYNNNGKYDSIDKESIKDPATRYYEYNKKYNITQYDYIYEREFRKAVLDFLQNGKCKLFKSPTEGNVIVRLTDISCTPIQSIDRMIYSFTATAHEIDEPTMENYLKYNFYKVGQWASVFEGTKETRIGQINEDIPIGTNIIDLIKNKYKTSNENVGVNGIDITGIHHLRITFDDKPLRIRTKAKMATEKGRVIYNNNDNEGENNGEYALGNNFIYNDQLFVVYHPPYLFNPVRIYEFDSNIIFKLTDTLYIPNNNEDSENMKKSIHVIVDFLYDIEEKEHKGKERASTITEINTGQLSKTCTFNRNIFNDIFSKHSYETETTFSELKYLISIDIESRPGATFTIKDKYGDSEEGETHIIGTTGVLRLYESSDDGIEIDGLTYKGITDNEGHIIEEPSDVLINYIYLREYGTYKTKTT